MTAASLLISSSGSRASSASLSLGCTSRRLGGFTRAKDGVNSYERGSAMTRRARRRSSDRVTHLRLFRASIPARSLNRRRRRTSQTYITKDQTVMSARVHQSHSLHEHETPRRHPLY